MGGHAFRSVLAPTAFPRLPPAVYNGLKARIQPILEQLYAHVGVPHEAPQKEDHGDLDFMVCLPRRSITNMNAPNVGDGSAVGDAPGSINVPHDLVAVAIRAKHCNPMEGNRTSNFAVPVMQGEWAQFGHEEEEAQARAEAGAEIFYQVDVNVCGTKEEWDRRMFVHSYGDLNMILGLIATNAGLHFSDKGLKYPDQPNPPILLSESLDDILKFFGWSMDEWEKGFETRVACYEWAAKTKYFDPSRFRTRGPGIKQRKPERKMYAGFIEWAGHRTQDHVSTNDTSGKTQVIPDAREAALDFFNKRTELEARRSEARRRELLKTWFSGSRIRDWTGLGDYWPGVKKIMDGVRAKFGGDENVAKFLDKEGGEELVSVVLEVQAELDIWPSRKVESGETETNAEAEEKLASGVKALKV